MGHLHVRFKPTTLFGPSTSVDILIVFYGLNFECKMHLKMMEYQPLFLPIDGSKILGPRVFFVANKLAQLARVLFYISVERLAGDEL